MQRAIPQRTNLILAIGFVSLNLFQFFYLPILLEASPAWGFVLIPLALLTPPFWALAHEAIHGILFSDIRWNNLAGRLLFILFGSPFYFLRFGHLVHHRYNRRPVDLDDLYDPRHESYPVRAAVYYFKLLGGTYVQEVLVPLLFWLPKKVSKGALERFMPSREASFVRVKRQAEAELIDDDAIHAALRVDTAAVYILFGIAFTGYGDAWWMLALALAARGFFVSFLDNLYHYGTKRDDVRYALYPQTPSWLQRYMLNFNLHYMHHRHPKAPWTALGTLVERDGRRPDIGYFTAALRQLRGPIPYEGI